MSAAPDEVRHWAQARLDARATANWAEADRLRALIEAAGWRIIDRGNHFSLEPAHAPDIVEEGRTRYGSSAAVPSRFDQPATASVTVVVVATDQPADLARALAGLRAHAPAGTQVVIVADGPSPEQASALTETLAEPGEPTQPNQTNLLEPIGGVAPEVIWTSQPLGRAAAINAGLRRSIAPVVVLLDTSVEPTGDLLSPLIKALDDPGVAVAGGWGTVSEDMRRFEDAPPGDVDAIDGFTLAFRRSEATERGFLDERFRFYLNLDIWWSLVLRDGGEDAPVRRALRVAELPAILHERPADSSLSEPERDRLSKRNFYRILDRFGARRDLLSAARP